MKLFKDLTQKSRPRSKIDFCFYSKGTPHLFEKCLTDVEMNLFKRIDTEKHKLDLVVKSICVFSKKFVPSFFEKCQMDLEMKVF